MLRISFVSAWILCKMDITIAQVNPDKLSKDIYQHFPKVLIILVSYFLGPPSWGLSQGLVFSMHFTTTVLKSNLSHNNPVFIHRALNLARVQRTVTFLNGNCPYYWNSNKFIILEKFTRRSFLTVTVKSVHLVFVLNFALILLLEEHYMTMSKIKKMLW